MDLSPYWLSLQISYFVDHFMMFVSQLNCLEYLHEHEYVHADIKASNLLLGLNNPDEVSSLIIRQIITDL